jgi:uncharacterized protein
MEYLIVAHDYKDKDALSRRMSVREKHIELIVNLKAQGKILYGVAILDDSGQMIGSAIISNFASRAELDDYLKIEPYVIGRVWETIEINPCQAGPVFAK